MTHPLFNAITAKLAEKVNQRCVAVWFDLRREFEPFIREWRAASRRDRFTA